MESSLSGGEALRRYEAIEKAYCEGRWATVLETGTVLLRQLPEGGKDREIKGLRHRMHLLMAHTLLHGYGDRDAAEDLYRVVHDSDAESSLRQIAADGLDQCHKPLSSTFVAEEDEENEEPLGQPSLFLPETEPADPDDLGASPRLPKGATVIALHQASPSNHPDATAKQEEATAPPPTRQEEVAPVDLGLAADPFQPTEVRTRDNTLHITVPVMPWAASQEATEEVPSEAEPLETPTTPAPSSRDDALGDSLTHRPLIPDVIEEPELVEVHQANPILAEEVDLVMTASAESLELDIPWKEDDPQPSLNMEDLRSSLLLFKLG
jgi:hypothetical protein